MNKKVARGRATTLKNSLGRNLQFFKNHDLNNIEQHIPLWFLRKVKCQIATINEKLLDCGYQPLIESRSEPLYKTTKSMGVGFIDTIKKDGRAIVLKGWAVDNDKKPCSSIVMVINNSFLIRPDSLSFYDRPDVEKAGIGNGIGCGFICSLSLPTQLISSVQIYTLNQAGLVSLEFPLNEELVSKLV
ncbi:hypothetical protein ID395_004829 [Escherichia coli]|nr:hypothetical protein [Escherichia coli]